MQFHGEGKRTLKNEEVVFARESEHFPSAIQGGCHTGGVATILLQNKQ